MGLVPLSRPFYDRDPAVVARELLGMRLIRQTSAGRCSGRIVETEAYLSQRDTASHSSRGQTPRNAAMFGPPGHAYIYRIHARWCLNAVTEPTGVASAILIRALEPLEGLDLMHQRRRTQVVRDLARGPARLCEALAIDRTLNHWDLTLGQDLWIADDPDFDRRNASIARSGRIGISSAQSRLLRFFYAGSPYVSGKRPPPASPRPPSLPPARG